MSCLDLMETRGKGSLSSLGEKVSFFALLFTMMSISSSPHPVLMLISYLVHEAGHLFFAKLVGAKIRKIRGGVFKLAISYDCADISYKREALVCLGGVIFNIGLAMLALTIKNSDIRGFLIVCNLSLAFMNLYPVSILDGGRIVKTVLLATVSEEKAEKISRYVSFFGAFLLWLIATYLQLVLQSNVSIFFISVFLLIQLCFSV